MKKTILIILLIITVTAKWNHVLAIEPWANQWQETGNSNWLTSSNWSAGRIPDYNDDISYANAFVAQVPGNISGPIVSLPGASFYKLQIGTTTDGPHPAKVTVQTGGALTGKDYILLGNETGTYGQFDNNGGIINIENYLTVGNSGTGLFNMNGGILNIASTLSIPSSSFGQGTFNLNSGLVKVSAAGSGVNIGPVGVLNVNGGTMDIDDKLRIWGDGGEINLVAGTIYATEIELAYGTLTVTPPGRVVIDGNCVDLITGYIEDGKIVQSNHTNYKLVVEFNGTDTTLAAVENGYYLWTGNEIPVVNDIGYVDGVEHSVIHKAIEGEYQFLHGAAIINHKGVFYSNWANSPVDENSEDECVRGRRSYDGGQTWSNVEIVAPALAGDEAHSHGVYFSDGNDLWFFASHFLTLDTQVDAYLLNEANDTWEYKGIAASGFHPFDEPQQMDNGKWIIGGDTNRPKVAIFDENNPMEWTIITIPIQQGTSLHWPETSLWVDGSKVTAITRNSNENKALISFSTDCGQSWTTATETNLPMSAAKPYCGILSSQQRYLIYNPPTPYPGRTTLAIAVSRPCEKTLSRVWKIRHGQSNQPLYPGTGKFPQWSYPFAIEHNDKLYVVYSIGKEDCGLSIIPLDSLYIRSKVPEDINSDCQVNFLDLADLSLQWLLEIN